MHAPLTATTDISPPPEVSVDGSTVTVSLRGEQDLSTATAVTHTLAQARSDQDADVLVDLSDIRFMDATILRALVEHWHIRPTRQRDLAWREPSPQARRLLEICGLVDAAAPTDTAINRRLDHLGRPARRPGRAQPRADAAADPFAA